ncbi:MAG: hypothetical protein ABIU09_00845 [Pyrinomonadaceae bacterium]
MLKRILNLFNPHTDDIARLVRAFPSALEKDVRALADILPFDERTIVVWYDTVHKLDFMVSAYKPDTIRLGEDEIQIPYRVYFREPEEDKIAALSDTQQAMLHCIYLRHHDGFVREKHLRSLIGVKNDFVFPFTIKLLGEYVIELLEILETMMSDELEKEFAELLVLNRKFWMRTQSRMTSYWDVYYRNDYPNLRNYVDKRLVDKLNRRMITVNH